MTTPLQTEITNAGNVSKFNHRNNRLCQCFKIFKHHPRNFKRKPKSNFSSSSKRVQRNLQHRNQHCKNIRQVFQRRQSNDGQILLCENIIRNESGERKRKRCATTHTCLNRQFSGTVRHSFGWLRKSFRVLRQRF